MQKISITKLIYKYSNPFLGDEVIARMMASSKWSESKYFGMSAEEIKDSWKKKATLAVEKGNKLHNAIRNFYETKYIVPEIEGFDNFLQIAKRIENKGDFKANPVLEKEISYKNLCGVPDALYYHNDGSLVIIDWKINEKIATTNNYQKMKYPIDHLDDCKHNLYALQLAGYSYLLGKKGCKTHSMLYCNLNGAYPDLVVVDNLEKEFGNLLEHYKNSCPKISLNSRQASLPF